MEYFVNDRDRYISKPGSLLQKSKGGNFIDGNGLGTSGRII